MALRLMLGELPIGIVELTKAGGTRREGLIKPLPGYASARPALQTLTIGMLGRDDLTPDTMREAREAAMRALDARGLALRDDAGGALPARLILVGDYFPADVGPALLDGTLRLPILVELVETPA